MAEQYDQLNQTLQKLIEKLGTFNDRIRIIEERSQQNRERLRVLDENLISKFKELKTETRRNRLEIEELRKNLEDITKTLKKVVNEISTFAKLSDIQVIEKVLDLIDPTRFLTKEDVIKIIKNQGA